MMAGRKETPGMRLACDGCHIRKLRCSRSSATCARCLRDGVQCVYSPSRKVGRPSKAEQMASKCLEKNSDANPTEVLETLRGNQSDYSATQQSEQEASHTAFWAQLGSDGYANIPLEGFWNEPHHSGVESNTGEGADQYGNMTMTIGSQAFPNDSVTINQSQNIHPTYHEVANSFGSKSTRQTTGNILESMTLITPPRKRSDSDAGASAMMTNTKIQRLSELQQELFAQRLHLPEFAGEEAFGEVVDVDAIMGTGQSIIELSRGLCTRFASLYPRAEQDMLGIAGGEYDPATMLLSISPSLLVVTTYNDIITLISSALGAIGLSGISRASQPPCPDAFADAGSDETNSDATSHQSKHNALFHGMTLKVGKLDLDLPLRLIISMSIIEYQLGPLERALQLIQSCNLRSQEADVSRNILAASVDGLLAAIEALLSKVGKLIHRAKLLDLG